MPAGVGSSGPSAPHARPCRRLAPRRLGSTPSADPSPTPPARPALAPLPDPAGPAPAAARPPALRARADEGSLDHYLRDISQFPLITREREAELARGIRAGDQDAMETLVRSNLRFVVSVAKKYQNQGVSLSDLINEGNLGLIRAAHKFDETKGIKFISYAVWWIRQAILQALAEQSRIVRVPLSQAGRDVPRESARQRAAAGAGARGHARRDRRGHGTDGGGRRAVACIAQAALSLDAPLAPGEGARLQDLLADEESMAPDEQMFERALSDAVAESLASLTAREGKILRLYFGLDGGGPMTLEVIGRRMGVTRERVRQIKEQALARLRQAERARSLASFFA
jgi:RNA polymerase primary sigma factor